MKNLFTISLRLIAVMVLLGAWALRAADPTTPATSGQWMTESNHLSDSQQALRSNLMLQEQVHNLQQTLDDYRKQASADARRAEDSVAAKLAIMERAFDDQRKSMETDRQRELDLIRNTNRTQLYLAAGFAVFGSLAMIFTVWFHTRTIQRLTGMATSFQLGAGAQPSMVLGAGAAPGQAVVDQTRERYLGGVERLQKRVGELEELANPTPHAGQPNGNDEPKPKAAGVTASATSSAVGGKLSQVAVLVGKGQTFLNLDQVEKALACFDEALALAPDHLDSLIKRGAALERLQRFDDAVAVYDRVIGLDGRQTTAYLLKGGVYNRLKRFNDALACYDLALKSQGQAKG